MMWSVLSGGRRPYICVIVCVKMENSGNQVTQSFLDPDALSSQVYYPVGFVPG